MHRSVSRRTEHFGEKVRRGITRTYYEFISGFNFGVLITDDRDKKRTEETIEGPRSSK